MLKTQSNDVYIYSALLAKHTRVGSAMKYNVVSGESGITVEIVQMCSLTLLACESSRILPKILQIMCSLFMSTSSLVLENKHGSSR